MQNSKAMDGHNNKKFTKTNFNLGQTKKKIFYKKLKQFLMYGPGMVFVLWYLANFEFG